MDVFSCSFSNLFYFVFCSKEKIIYVLIKFWLIRRVYWKSHDIWLFFVCVLISTKSIFCSLFNLANLLWTCVQKSAIWNEAHDSNVANRFRLLYFGSYKFSVVNLFKTQYPQNAKTKKINFWFPFRSEDWEKCIIHLQNQFR